MSTTETVNGNRGIIGNMQRVVVRWQLYYCDMLMKFSVQDMSADLFDKPVPNRCSTCKAVSLVKAVGLLTWHLIDLSCVVSQVLVLPYQLPVCLEVYSIYLQYQHGVQLQIYNSWVSSRSGRVSTSRTAFLLPNKHLQGVSKPALESSMHCGWASRHSPAVFADWAKAINTLYQAALACCHVIFSCQQQS